MSLADTLKNLTEAEARAIFQALDQYVWWPRRFRTQFRCSGRAS